MTTTPTHQRVQVHNGNRPSEDRFIVLTTVRLLATDVWLVAVVDGTGRLADPASLLVTPSHERARRHGNRLLNDRWGGEEVAPTHYAHHLPRPIAQVRGYGEAPRPPRPVTVDTPKYRPRLGVWEVRWQAPDRAQRSRRRFRTEHEAQEFYARLTNERNHR